MFKKVLQSTKNDKNTQNDKTRTRKRDKKHKLLYERKQNRKTEQKIYKTQ